MTKTDQKDTLVGPIGRVCHRRPDCRIFDPIGSRKGVREQESITTQMRTCQEFPIIFFIDWYMPVLPIGGGGGGR